MDKLDETHWIKVWNVDTAVMKTSLSAPVGKTDQRLRTTESSSSNSNSRSARGTGYDADDERTRILQAELQDSIQPARPNGKSKGRLKATKATKQVAHKSTSNGKRKIVETHVDQVSKRQRNELRQMAELAINSRAMAGPWTGASDMHEVPSWYDFRAVDV